VTATVPLASHAFPQGVAITPDGARAYVTNVHPGTVSVIDTATNTVTATITVGDVPRGVAITPDGARAYVTNEHSDTVSVIDTATNTVTATITVGDFPFGVAITPDGARAYVTNTASSNVSVIDTATNTATTTVAVGTWPTGVAITPATAPAPTITSLIDDVEGLGLHPGTERSLVRKLEGAQKNVDKGELDEACEKLASFAEQVEALSGKKIDPDDAEELTADATAVREDLGC
jgi:YVTN family beta-propeller protein